MCLHPNKWIIFKNRRYHYWIAENPRTHWQYSFDNWREAFNYALSNGTGPSFTHH